MSKMSRTVKDARYKDKTKAVTNFMGGTSYELNPLETMKMVTASSIFGEPQYYNDSKDKRYNTGEIFYVADEMKDYVIPSLLELSHMKKSTAKIMETVIDNALHYDFKATLEYAVVLRKQFLMRLNPQIIMVRAAIMTEERIAFTNQYPGLFSEINQKVMSRGDDVIHQMTYYLFLNDGKASKVPGILKNSWKKNIENLTRYELHKYKNAGLGLINTIRICHAHNKDIAELMNTGDIKVPPCDTTWELLRASGKSWAEILDTIRMNHMALLRNLRGIFTEISDYDTAQEILEQLEAGVTKGKQFPYRYLSAHKAIDKADNIMPSIQILDSLENCIDKACENLPHLAGNNAFLSDNSGSAWGACPSEYGTMTVAEIGNLSSIIGAVNSDVGTVFCFGDKLISHPISKRTGILQQAKQINTNRGHDVGMSTENGIWLFFKKALAKNIHYDNIFIYSDMQAGHGGLYGTDSEAGIYRKAGYATHGKYIDVAKLIQTYRSQVNPKVNVYCIQTAGYTNVLVPESGYRTNILYGWTGKELLYADAMNKFWDEYDQKRSKAAQTE